MFRKVFIFTALFLCVLFPAAKGGNRVEFGCENLENAILERTGGGSVTIPDMLALTGAVDLAGLGITGLSGLEYLVNAESLDLSDNAVTDMTPLTELKSLRRLDLSGNRLSTLPADIDLMASLEELDISDNTLEYVPRQIADIPRLKKLVLENCGLRDIPELQPLADTLVWLSLSGNDLLDYSTLLNLSGLELLGLERCNLSVLPDLSLLCNLHYLYLNDNSLKSLPAYLSELPLIRLEARHNHIAKLPDSFAGLSGLKQLVLGGNAFSELPGVLLAMPGLEVLMLDANMLAALPPEIAVMTGLRRVSFTANDMDSLDGLANFRLAPPGQISFALNRLDFSEMSAASIFTLAGLGTGTQAQKNGSVRLEIIKADSQAIDFKLIFAAEPDRELKFGELVPVEIRLYDMASGLPELMQRYEPTQDLVFSYAGHLQENRSYKLRALLAMKYSDDPDRLILYHDDVVIYELAPAPTKYTYPDGPPIG